MIPVKKRVCLFYIVPINYPNCLRNLEVSSLLNWTWLFAWLTMCALPIWNSMKTSNQHISSYSKELVHPLLCFTYYSSVLSEKH